MKIVSILSIFTSSLSQTIIVPRSVLPVELSVNSTCCGTVIYYQLECFTETYVSLRTLIWASHEVLKCRNRQTSGSTAICVKKQINILILFLCSEVVLSNDCGIQRHVRTDKEAF